MGEAGLSPGEVSKEIAEHLEHTSSHGEMSPADRRITIVEAVLLALVAILAAYSGFASAKWGTEQSLTLARASATRSQANRAYLESLEAKNFDATAFNAWFTAYINENEQGMAVAEKRFSPELQVAFDAWMTTDPFNNPDAPDGPTYMAEYDQPKADEALELDQKADELYAEGAEAGRNADDYVRTAVFLATVLFLVGISGHFRLRGARYGLISVASVLLILSVGLLLTTPYPPG
jgi:hypothetical protein